MIIKEQMGVLQREYKIVSMTMDDIDSIELIEAVEFPEIKDDIQTLKAEPSITPVVVNVGGELGAYCFFDSTGFVLRIWVNPKYRGKGIGRSLVSYVSENAESSVWLCTHKDSKANGFYSRLGLDNTSIGDVTWWYEKKPRSKR